MIRYFEELKIAKKLARQAGKEVLKYYKKNYNIDYKSKNDPVTEADLASQKIILGGLKKFNYGILSEETLISNNRFNKERVWIIDPLDGTKDFIDKTGEFVIMIGLADNGTPVMGVVYHPVLDIMYYAVKNRGAFRVKNKIKKKILVSKQKDLKKIKILVSRYHLQEREINLAKNLNFKKVIACGSMIKVCLVADGQVDININTSDRTKEWDTCAVDIILREAGGKFTDMNGRNLKYNKKNVYNRYGYLATNGLIHEKVLKTLKNFKK